MTFIIEDYIQHFATFGTMLCVWLSVEYLVHRGRTNTKHSNWQAFYRFALPALLYRHVLWAYTDLNGEFRFYGEHMLPKEDLENFNLRYLS